MSKQDEGSLILKLYELRRDETMRKARNWYFTEFHPESLADFTAAMFGEHSGHLRMVTTYWDMAAALVNSGAISMDIFDAANGEHIGVFAKLESLLPEIRAAHGPQYLQQFEKLIDATPNGRKRVAEARERLKQFRANMARTSAQG